mgnify:CR=1 FL=1
MKKVMTLETMTCKCCGCNELNLLYEGKDRLHGLPGEFVLFACSNCGVVSVRPQLSNEEIEKYYPEDYISYPVPIDKERSGFRRLDRQHGVTKRRRKVEGFTNKKGGKILDIGCATGVFLKEMKDHGWDVYGVEPSSFAADVAINQLGLNVFNGYLAEANFDDNFFDIITLWDVFEHLPDPVENLLIIKRLLKPDGNLIIATPNTNSWERKIFEQYWAGWDIPRHYHIFSEVSIEQLLKEHGMQVDKLISFTGMLGTIRISLDFWLQEKVCSEQMKRWLRTVYYSIIFRLLSYPYTIISNFFSKSTNMTVFASSDLSKDE